MSDHNYNLSVFQEACDENVIEDMESVKDVFESISKEQKVNWEHTPIKNQK